MRPLRIAIETQFASGTPTGLGVYAQALAAALAARDDIELVELQDPRLDIWRFDRRVYWDQVRAPSLAAAAHVDVIHFTGGTLPLLTPHPCVLTVHDLAWLHDAVGGRVHSRLYFGAMQGRLARRADLIATTTEIVRGHILEALAVKPSRVAVCGCGVDPSWFELQHRPVDPPYVLCVGTVEERKDLITAVRALGSLGGVRLISAGPYTGYAARVRHAAMTEGVDDRVELRGFVEDEQLRMLYAGASALVFPSRYEGFGLPPLQALAAGLPVVASDLPVLREVLGDCALFARPGDPASFADLLRLVIAAEPRAGELVARGREQARRFTWTEVAQRMVELYKTVAGTQAVGGRQ